MESYAKLSFIPDVLTVKTSFNGHQQPLLPLNSTGGHFANSVGGPRKTISLDLQLLVHTTTD